MVGKIHPKKKRYPCYVGVWLNAAQREKLETIAQDSHRGIGETMRLLLDNAVVRHVEFDLRTPIALTSEDTVSSWPQLSPNKATAHRRQPVGRHGRSTNPYKGDVDGTTEI